MKKESISTRLKQLMSECDLRQVDILKKAQPYCKKYNINLGRNDISQYISGRVEPSQQKLSLLAEALNVSEIWLMGYDVPRNEENMEMDVNNEKQKRISFDHSALEGKIKQYYDTQDNLANDIPMSRSSLNQRLNNNLSFNTQDIYKICTLLHIPIEEIGTYFFTLKV
ncbi:MAG: DUF739 family protein [Clostridia bacterium]|nr:DUF739 family protein [Clostridia bacterium]